MQVAGRQEQSGSADIRRHVSCWWRCWISPIAYDDKQLIKPIHSRQANCSTCVTSCFVFNKSFRSRNLFAKHNRIYCNSTYCICIRNVNKTNNCVFVHLFFATTSKVWYTLNLSFAQRQVCLETGVLGGSGVYEISVPLIRPQNQNGPAGKRWYLV